MKVIHVKLSCINWTTVYSEHNCNSLGWYHVPIWLRRNLFLATIVGLVLRRNLSRRTNVWLLLRRSLSRRTNVGLVLRRILSRRTNVGLVLRMQNNIFNYILALLWRKVNRNIHRNHTWESRLNVSWGLIAYYEKHNIRRN